MHVVENSLNFFGRLLFVALFLPAGVAKLTGFEGTVGYFSSLGLPLPSVAVVAAIVIEILGSLALLFGVKVRAVAIVLAIFTLLASFAGHAYWAVPQDQMFVQQLLFFKNIAIAGGLILLAITGAGKLSIDNRLARA